MRKDLKHWSEALKLADQLDPESIPVISKEHAASLEMTGEYNNAKIHYQQAMDSLMVSNAILTSTNDKAESFISCREATIPTSSWPAGLALLVVPCSLGTLGKVVP
jgi:hypothetical protein